MELLHGLWMLISVIAQGIGPFVGFLVFVLLTLWYIDTIRYIRFINRFSYPQMPGMIYYNPTIEKEI